MILPELSEISQESRNISGESTERKDGPARSVQRNTQSCPTGRPMLRYAELASTSAAVEPSSLGSSFVLLSKLLLSRLRSHLFLCALEGRIATEPTEPSVKPWQKRARSSINCPSLTQTLTLTLTLIFKRGLHPSFGVLSFLLELFNGRERSPS